MVTFNKLYAQFLSSISSYTLSQLSDDEIQAELFNLASRAIAAFKFPKVPLTYVEVENPNTGEIMPTFNEDISQKELNVLLAHMKVLWIEFQISKEERTINLYYDDNVRTFSAANMIAQLNRMYENFVIAAKRAEYDYGRVATDGKPRIGDINV
jgi:hypothetical protein